MPLLLASTGTWNVPWSRTVAPGSTRLSRPDRGTVRPATTIRTAEPDESRLFPGLPLTQPLTIVSYLPRQEKRIRRSFHHSQFAGGVTHPSSRSISVPRAQSGNGTGGAGHMRMNLGTSRKLITLAMDNMAAAMDEL